MGVKLANTVQIHYIYICNWSTFSCTWSLLCTCSWKSHSFTLALLQPYLYEYLLFVRLITQRHLTPTAPKGPRCHWALLPGKLLRRSRDLGPLCFSHLTPGMNKRKPTNRNIVSSFVFLESLADTIYLLCSVMCAQYIEGKCWGSYSYCQWPR